MAGTRVKIPTANLEPGMFVAQLDRPWLETPFIAHGFCVQTDDEIRRLRQFSRHAYVDLERSTLPADRVLAARDPEAGYASRVAAGPARRPPVPATAAAGGWFRDAIARLPGRLFGRGNLPVEAAATVAASVGEEAPRAAVAYDLAGDTIVELFDQVRGGRRVDAGPMRAAAGPLIDSILRNEDAMAWLVFLRKRAAQPGEPSAASAVWAVVLGRHLGLERQALENLALGGMLLDIGEARLPPSVLNRQAVLDAVDHRIIQKHVEAGLSLVRNTPGINADVLTMIEFHHERFDGSGYPRGLAGDAIPVLGRVAGIVDCFDAMTTRRPHAAARSAYDAVRELNGLAGIHFQPELVERLVEALGMFPTGCLVSLNSGEVGIVVEQNSRSRLRPRVLILLDADKSPVRAERIVDLGEAPANPRTPGAVWIDKGLDPGAFGLDPKDYFAPAGAAA